ncbi:GerMN domain-containing protein [Isachenkonia alkalipeptolytica]|uniref:Uncharacterized protein n=1 Tax=Isachenkonia alkalipeptolytica TaxID=2565777 RepID=A0AA43XJ67_9CLOT|nr:GerMN domain-containing protein [Isachenkonia alkalipeptolytica]NBG87304.1 hypothetical protein [Isachenkonia alkalipeptolytica]
MLRGIAKLLLLIILVFMATGFPIYFDRMDAESFWERASSRIESPEDPESPEANGTLYFHHDLERQSEESFLLHMTIENRGEAVNFQEDLVDLTITHGGQQLKSLNLNDFNIDIPFGETIDPEETIEFSIELDRRSLGLPYESYVLEVQPRSDLAPLDAEDLELAFSFEENFTYLPAIPDIPGSETALTLYFPTSMEDYSVPVTRIIPYTSMQIRATVDGLFDGPQEELGLTVPEEGIMPPWRNLAFDNGLATINLSEDLEDFDEDATLGQQAYRAYAYSVNATSFTDRVQFTFDRRTREEAFGGFAVEDPVTLPEGPVMYFGYETDTERFLLVPRYLQEDPPFVENQNYYNEDFELEDPQGFYQLLSYAGHPDYYNEQQQPLIKDSVELNSLELEDNTLEITFDEGAMESISQDAEQAMLDGLLLSFTSFSNVDAVVFHITDYEEDSLHHYSIGSPMEAPNHINPEEPRDD